MTALESTLVLHPGSRLDVETAESFRTEVNARLQPSTAGVVVDLGPTRDMDVAGLAALVNLLVRCRASGLPIALIGPLAPPVERLLDYSGFYDLFERHTH